MVKLEDVEFPSKYLNCYEAVIVMILKYMGLADETPLMGTQAYFVLRETELSVSPRFNSVTEEWKRIHGLTVETLPVANENDLRGKILAKLNKDIPVSLPVDIYLLPYTPHHNRLHQPHYVDLFGYDDNQYYVVCPYYRFRGWIGQNLVHRGFFAPVVELKNLVFIPELELVTLSPERIGVLVQENCQNMLNLKIPDPLAHKNPHCLGLAGLHTFSELAWESVVGERRLSQAVLLNLSRQVRWIGRSRYWFHRLLQTSEERLLSRKTKRSMQEQFVNVMQCWQDIGVRLGAGVQGKRPEMIEWSALHIRHVYEQEKRLFNSLLSELPGYEAGKL
jgi:hypothetical protein